MTTLHQLVVSGNRSEVSSLSVVSRTAAAVLRGVFRPVFTVVQLDGRQSVVVAAVALLPLAGGGGAHLAGGGAREGEVVVDLGGKVQGGGEGGEGGREGWTGDLAEGGRGDVLLDAPLALQPGRGERYRLTHFILYRKSLEGGKSKFYFKNISIKYKIFPKNSNFSVG